MSAPNRTTRHSRLPHGCSRRSWSTSPIRRSSGPGTSGTLLRRGGPGEREAVDEQRGDPGVDAAVLRPDEPGLRADRRDATERLGDGLREAEVADRPDDAAALDQECAVLGHPGQNPALAVDDVHIVEARHP